MIMEVNKLTKQFIDTTNFYLREVKKGKEKIGVVSIDLLQGSNNVVPCYFNTSNKKILSYIVYDEELSLNLSLISSEIFNLFNINAPLSYYIYNDEGKKAIINLNNQNDREIFTTSEEILTNLVSSIKRGIITLPGYLKKYLNILKNKTVDEEAIISLIEISINVMSQKYNLDDKERQRLLTNFLELIIVDYITLNTNRNSDTYGFLIDKVKSKINITSTYLKKNSLSSYFYNLNGLTLEFNRLLEVIFKDYYDYIKALVISIIDNRNVYEKCINLIIDANSSLNYSDDIKEKISSRLDDLLILNNSIDKSKISKIDLVLTKTNVNLKIVNKTSDVMLKYQNYESVPMEVEESKLVINYDEDKGHSHVYNLVWMLVIIVIVVVVILFLNKI